MESKKNCYYFGDFNDESSKVSKMKSDAMSEEGRGYRLMDNLGTDNNVIYLKKVEIISLKIIP